MEHLSNIELYYSEPGNFADGSVIIRGDDFHHITRVMRHSAGDEIFVTNGEGKIFSCSISSTTGNELAAQVEKEYSFENKFGNITFCLPKLKSSDRFEFALEKAAELGVVNFMIFNSARTVAKGSKIERWNKIAVAAMKQSLRSYLPVISEVKGLIDIVSFGGELVAFEQNSSLNLTDLRINGKKNYYFIFGPEGGLDGNELSLFNDQQLFNLAGNRLRSETAVIKAASLLPALF